MSVYLVIDWQVPRGHEAETDAALAAVRDHIAASHRQIRSVRVTRELAEDKSQLGYRWEERYDCLADSQSVDLSEECDEEWLQVWHVAVPGTHRQSLWDDEGRSDWLTPTEAPSS